MIQDDDAHQLDKCHRGSPASTLLQSEARLMHSTRYTNRFIASTTTIAKRVNAVEGRCKYSIAQISMRFSNLVCERSMPPWCRTARRHCLSVYTTHLRCPAPFLTYKTILKVNSRSTEARATTHGVQRTRMGGKGREYQGDARYIQTVVRF